MIEKVPNPHLRESGGVRPDSKGAVVPGGEPDHRASYPVSQTSPHLTSRQDSSHPESVVTPRLDKNLGTAADLSSKAAETAYLLGRADCWAMTGRAPPKFLGGRTDLGMRQDDGVAPPVEQFVVHSESAPGMGRQERNGTPKGRPDPSQYGPGKPQTVAGRRNPAAQQPATAARGQGHPQAATKKIDGGGCVTPSGGRQEMFHAGGSHFGIVGQGQPPPGMLQHMKRVPDPQPGKWNFGEIEIFLLYDIIEHSLVMFTHCLPAT